MRVTISLERDGRIIAEVRDLPGVLVYGTTVPEAYFAAKELAMKVQEDRNVAKRE